MTRTLGKSRLVVALMIAAGLVSAVLAVAASVARSTPEAGPSSIPRPLSVVKGAGEIRRIVDRYRALLGPDNGGAPGGYASGRREINWDRVPDEFARPHLLPADFFNARVDPRARGVVFLTPGSGVAVSADRDNPSHADVRFGDVNTTYPARFRTFSPERLFSPIGSNIVNLRFYVPGTSKRAAVRGFGAVYTDIDRPENTAFEYFDAHGRSLGKFAVPPRPNGLSFLGVVFRDAVVARVRIEYGNHALGPTDSNLYDVAVMDDFIYGEPQPIRA